jgi:hypothetical protein
MRRFLALLMVFAGLIGAGAPAIACAIGAAGDCCPTNAPSGCTPEYQQLGVESSVCCVAAAAPAQIVSAEPGREVQGRNPGSPDPNVLPLCFASSLSLRVCGAITTPAFCTRCTDASLTYLHTGRLRL